MVLEKRLWMYSSISENETAMKQHDKGQKITKGNYPSVNATRTRD